MSVSAMSACGKFYAIGGVGGITLYKLKVVVGAGANDTDEEDPSLEISKIELPRTVTNSSASCLSFGSPSAASKSNSNSKKNQPKTQPKTVELAMASNFGPVVVITIKSDPKTEKITTTVKMIDIKPNPSRGPIVCLDFSVCGKFLATASNSKLARESMNGSGGGKGGVEIYDNGGENGEWRSYWKLPPTEVAHTCLKFCNGE